MSLNLSLHLQEITRYQDTNRNRPEFLSFNNRRCFRTKAISSPPEVAAVAGRRLLPFARGRICLRSTCVVRLPAVCISHSKARVPLCMLPVNTLCKLVRTFGPQALARIDLPWRRKFRLVESVDQRLILVRKLT